MKYVIGNYEVEIRLCAFGWYAWTAKSKTDVQRGMIPAQDEFMALDAIRIVLEGLTSGQTAHIMDYDK